MKQSLSDNLYLQAIISKEATCFEQHFERRYKVLKSRNKIVWTICIYKLNLYLQNESVSKSFYDHETKSFGQPVFASYLKQRTLKSFGQPVFASYLKQRSKVL